jgi:hypothetical protein
MHPTFSATLAEQHRAVLRVGGRGRPGRPIARRRGIVRPQGAEPAPRKTALWPRRLVDP